MRDQESYLRFGERLQDTNKAIRVLYVDDEPEMLAVTGIHLEETGEFIVDTVSSAVSALSSFSIQSYDAVVSDYQMPEMDGIAFLKEVRRRYGDIPFILFLGKGDEEILIDAINNGADFYLQKSKSKELPFVELAYGIRQAVAKKRAKDAIRESEEKYRSILENASEIVYSLTPEGIVSYISPNVTDILGYTYDEVMGKPALSFLHPDDYSLIRDHFNNTLKTGKKTSNIVYRVRHKEGSWQWHSQSYLPIRDAENRIAGVQGISYDITEQKKTEDALRIANRQLSLLTEITRHDILNSVMVILGNLSLLEMDYKDPGLLTSLQKIKLATIEIQSQIEFTRAFGELCSHDPTWISLDTVMPYSSVPDSVTLITDLQNVFIFVDPMIQKVFFNLLDNSLRHGRRVTTIHSFLVESGNDIIVVWEDNGAGIEPSEKERIFQRGYGKHTGLGMFLIREILSLTGISIHETGVYGQGVRFEMVVPKGAWCREIIPES
ncbi:MAG: PAS domain S-box protein [Methanospirillaceae archaeon]|nr:PAS domain S-box protein [Methanospirillaceae archaeon]